MDVVVTIKSNVFLILFSEVMLNVCVAILSKKKKK